MNLPPLPRHHAIVGRFDDEQTPVYTGDQMRTYAAEAVRAAIAEASLHSRDDQTHE